MLIESNVNSLALRNKKKNTKIIEKLQAFSSAGHMILPENKDQPIWILIFPFGRDHMT